MRSLGKLFAILAPLALAAPVLATAACGSDTGPSSDSCTGDKCDDLDLPDSEIPDSACDGVMRDVSGRRNAKVAGRLHDPVAQLLWHNTESCPTTYQDIMAKLREVDNDGCSGERDGIRTRVVSETAQLADEPTSYRLVTSRRCGDRAEHEVLFSLFGVRAGATSLPETVELIAFDKSEGVFNYYEAGPGEISFFGNSRDMKKGSEGNTRRCAQCHTGGGLIMKELDTPWMHWEGHTDTPGAADLVSAHPDLGTKASGSNMESVVKAGNREWNEARVDFLLEQGTLRDVLEPLFCTVEVNIDNGSDFPTTKMDSFSADSLLDPHLKGFGFLDIENQDYLDQMEENGQEVPGMGAADTLFAYAFIERAHADNNFVDALISRKIITEEFAKDVLAVDFTRPIFSSDRCDLLQQMPTERAKDATAEELTDSVIAALAGAEGGTPAGDLLANLEAEGGHNDIVDAFMESCEGLTSKQRTERMMRIQSLNRTKARELHVFEFPQTLPTDNLRVNEDSRLDPTNCELTNDYVSIQTAAAQE